MCSTCDPQARKQKIFSIRIFKCSVSIIPAQKFACLKIKVKLVLKVSTPHLSRPKTCKGIQSQTIQETTTGLLYASVAGHRGCLASSARKKKNQEFIPISWKMHPDPARGGLVGIQGHQDPHSLWHDARKQIKAKPK